MEIKFNEPMKQYTTFKVGGIADKLIFPQNIAELQEILDIEKNCVVLGKGSNVLVRDKGIRETVIITTSLDNIEVFDDTIIAECGAELKNISKVCQENELTGFEFASGIPGTVGGAVFMNAGAYGSEMKNIVEKVEMLIDDNGNYSSVVFNNEEMQFGYRKSLAQIKNDIITKVHIKLQKGSQALITDEIVNLTKQREEKQPLEFGSAGSTFKRPEGFFAAKLIMDSGLRGYKIGDAQISEKHCGFIINRGNATATDIINLIEHTKQTVKQKCNVLLEEEVLIIGEK